MATWIVLFRGINVGGHRPLPMKSLAASLGRAGFLNVRTYVQSGNVVLESPAGTAPSIARRIRALVLSGHGFEPGLVVLSRRELATTVRENPFPAAAATPTSLHVFFLAGVPRAPDLAALKRLRRGSEAFALRGKRLYVQAPDGLGGSRLGAGAERHVGVEATARNWRTVQALADLSAPPGRQR